MQNISTILCLDIGSRTTDAFLYTKSDNPSNMSRFILPSAAYYISQKIKQYTASRRDIYLYGSNMGGGFRKAALEHIAAGLSITMHQEAAYSLTNTPQSLENLGIKIANECPPQHVPLLLCDYDHTYWVDMINISTLPNPELTLVAAQDHGFNPSGSSRESRMDMWKKFLHSAKNPADGAMVEDLMYPVCPEILTRLSTIQNSTGNPVMDSAAAALAGMLSIEAIKEESYGHGVVLINAGNSHISAFLVYKGNLFGIYEHHTHQIEPEVLFKQLKNFRLGWLPDEEVRNTGGHGTAFLPLPPEAEGFGPAFVLGPQMDIFKGQAKFANCGRDVMMNGCFGLLYAWQQRMEQRD